MQELNMQQVEQVSGGDGMTAAAYTVGAAVATGAVVGASAAGLVVTAPVVAAAAVVYSIGFAIGYFASN